MGKAARRRRHKRQKYLESLARNNPVKFASEWAKRLDSWSKEAARRAQRLTDRNSNRVPAAFTLVDYAMNELAACGVEAIELAREATIEIMTDSCCREVAESMDRRLRFTKADMENQ